ncbi:unnamed protein product [Tetraodon nigroviridis]|uniref:Chromosome 9 SCAF14729, whole genome shotgun sequence n=1 Tax=Tetraodon nigroviridis TaxID=99883 RepID=Q4S5V8_TETNG|nr:unnamed protein product [Tetraodon nigroviridis]
MSGEQPLESLIRRNRTLVDNCNALKKLIVAYENKSPQLQHLDGEYILLDAGPIEYYCPPLHIDLDLDEVIALEIENADLEKLTATLFRKLQEIETLLKNYQQDLDSPTSEDLQHLLKLGKHEGRVDAERDATKVSLRARYQHLLQSIADVQNQKKQLEKLNGVNETMMGKLTEENDALQDKVKQLENNVQNLSPVSDRIAHFLIKKTDVEAEKKEYQEELNSLLKERMDMEDMEEDLHGQLTRMKDFSNYINLIKELEQQVDDLQDSAKMIKHREEEEAVLPVEKNLEFLPFRIRDH